MKELTAKKGIPLDGFRELITIKSKDAPREYTFNFNMSKGYRLITSEEYCSEHNNKADEEKLLVEPGVVYIVDPNPHPNKTRTLYLTKNQVRKWRNKSENSFAGQSVEYVVSGLIGIANTPAGLASGAIFLVGNQYLSIKKHSFNV